MAHHFHSHHKGASQWIKKYLLEFSKLNNLSFWTSDLAIFDHRALEADIVFWGNSNYELAANDMCGTHFVRNPVNLIISAYYSHLKTHPVEPGWCKLDVQRKLLNSVSHDQGLALTVSFLERNDFGFRTPGPLHALRNWDFSDERFTNLRIEDLFNNPRLILQAYSNLSNMILPSDNDFTFEAMSGGRQPGEIDENSHYRSGDVKNWKTHHSEFLKHYVSLWLPQLTNRFYPELLVRE